ncbi:MAG TPA: ATP-binding protein [Thermoplasmata archaeon]
MRGTSEGGPARLTAKERILLHLLDYARFSEALEVPSEVTQDGLAAAAEIDLRHFTQYARPLIDEELLRERTAHVKGSRQRRKVYDLTLKGQMAAHGLRDRLKAEPVRVRDAAGVREISLARLSEEIGGRLSLLALAQRADRGVLDLEALAVPERPSAVEVLADAPRIEGFVGRKAELEALTASAEGPRIFVVRGVAGIGKSSLGAKACEVMRGRCNLYWHGIRPWDTRTSVLAGLAEFLSALGRPGLRAVLVRGEAGVAAEVLREDLPGSRAFLVIDDAHHASGEVVQLLRFLKDTIAEAPDVRALVLTRQSLPFYDRRDVAIRKLVRELDLGGLAPNEVVDFLAAGQGVELTNLGRRLGGHPLFLELVRSAGHPSVRPDALRDVERFIEEEIYSDLSDPERTTLKAASMYRVPVPWGALLAAPAVTHDVVLALRNRALLRPAGDDAWQVHDTVRDFFAGIVTPSEREDLARFARAQLRDLAAKSQSEGHLGACVDYLSNALALTPPGDERVAVREHLGDAEERMGDLPAALIAYREALQDTADAEVRGRLHRKLATAFVMREQKEPAAEELDAGLRALGETASVERGWLGLVRFGIAWREEKWEEAQESVDEALRTFRDFRASDGQAQALHYIGKLQIDSPHGDLSLAQRSFEEALALACSLDDFELQVKIRTGMAHLLAYRLGDVEAAQRHIAAMEAMIDRLRDPHARRAFLMLQGWFYLELLADCETAEARFSEAQDLARRIHDPSTISAARYGLAFCDYFRGHLPKAREEFERLAGEMNAAGLSADAIECWWMAAECSLRLGDLSGFEEAAARVREPGLVTGAEARPFHVLALRGIERFLRGDREGSRAAFDDALRGAEQTGVVPDPALVGFLHFYYAVTLRVAGDDAAAEAHLKRVNEVLRAQHLQARLQLLPIAERELSESLRCASAPR